MRRALSLAAIAGALSSVAALACTDVSSDASEPFQIAFDSLPSPSIVAGDTMRDTLGRASRLTAEVFNADGDRLDDAEVVFVPSVRGTALETVNDILPGGYAIGRADSLADQVQIVALAGRLQSVARAVDVVHAPTTLRVDGSSDIQVLYRAGIDTTSPNLRVRVGYDTADTFRGVKSWLVRFRVVYPALPPGDTSAAAFLVADSTSLRRAGLDTTASDGLATRAVRLRPARLASPNDSLVVEVRATYRSELVGSPVRMVVRFVPRP